jgi:hypothetical protein
MKTKSIEIKSIGYHMIPEKIIRLPRWVWEEVDSECEMQGKLYKQEREKLKTQCKHCGYRWFYKGKLKRCTCPNCKGTTQSRIITEEDEKAIGETVNKAFMEWRRQRRMQRRAKKKASE